MLRNLVIALSVVVINISSAAAATTAFFFESSPTSFIGRGESLLATRDDFFIGVGASSGGQTVQVNVLERNFNSFWHLDLSAPAGQTLAVGLYTSTVIYPVLTGGNPGLNFYGDGRGNSTLSGSFEVFEITYNTDGSLASFAANFTQHDQTLPDRWNNGGIRFNSDVAIYTSTLPVIISIPTAVPEPETYAMLIAGLGLIGFFARRKL